MSKKLIMVKKGFFSPWKIVNQPAGYINIDALFSSLRVEKNGCGGRIGVALVDWGWGHGYGRCSQTVSDKKRGINKGKKASASEKTGKRWMKKGEEKSNK